MGNLDSNHAWWIIIKEEPLSDMKNFTLLHSPRYVLLLTVIRLLYRTHFSFINAEHSIVGKIIIR